MASSPLYSIQSVCVFSGATLGKNVRFRKATDNFIEVMAAKKISIIYGGGNTGLRGREAPSALMGDIKICGVILKLLADSPLVGLAYGNELRVLSMHDRIKSMGNTADAFVVLIGGFDTLEDLFHMLSWGILAFLDSLIEKGFASPPSRRLLLCATTPEELIDKFLAYIPEPDPTAFCIVHIDASTSGKCALDLALSL
ncbi:hypothetical protein OROMI_006850 [Orobanche minor]